MLVNILEGHILKYVFFFLSIFRKKKKLSYIMQIQFKWHVKAYFLK